MCPACQAELERRIEALHDFILQVAERLFLAAEVLSIRAERKTWREPEESGSGPA